MGGLPSLGRDDLSCDICGVPGAEPYLAAGGQPGLGQTLTLWVDVYDRPNEYCLVADVPGVSKNDVNITLEEDNILKIKIDRLFPRIEGGVLLKERDFGRFLRWLRLPRNVETTKMSAKVDNGQLTITIPKKPIQERQRQPQGQQLQITGPSPSASESQEVSPKQQALQEKQGYQEKGQMLGDIPPLSQSQQQQAQQAQQGQTPQLGSRQSSREQPQGLQQQSPTLLGAGGPQELVGQMGVPQSPPLQAQTQPQQPPHPQVAQQPQQQQQEKSHARHVFIK